MNLNLQYIDLNEFYIFVFVATISFIVIWFIYNLYELFKPIHWYYKNFLKTWLTWFIFISFVAYFLYWFIFFNWISRFVIIFWWVYVFILFTIFDSLYNIINWYFEKKTPYKVIILYKNKVLFDKLQKNLWFYEIYSIEGKDSSQLWNDLNILLDFDIIVNLWIDDIWLVQEIFDYARLKWKKFFNISQSYFLEDLIYVPERFWSILVFEYKSSPLDWRYRVVKRVFDIIFSIFWIIILSPFFFIVSILIYFDSGFPIFYVQKRVWRNWKLFNFIKFRSMFTNFCLWEKYWWEKAQNLYENLINSEKNIRKWPLAKIKDDPRITKIWKFIRKTSLDELPQLFSILIWDMSIVWPRPHMPEEVKKYSWWHKRLLSLKPWITWYSQIFWRDKLDFDEEAKLDLYYIQNWSIFMDIYVIITTLKVVFSWK